MRTSGPRFPEKSHTLACITFLRADNEASIAPKECLSSPPAASRPRSRISVLLQARYNAGMADINFREIAPRCGGQEEAFEELCCQIAIREPLNGGRFVRLRGAGGDGGVECFAEMADGTKVGWQAKYLFDIEALLRQVTASLATALTIHRTLSRYVVCFPFDLTGPTSRRGKSELEKFESWRKSQEAAAKKQGRNLTIEDWPASRIRSRLLVIDPRGGIREYFFNHTILSRDWFSEHIESARNKAGPRYTPELSVQTDIWKWFEALVHAPSWSDTLSERVRNCQECCGRLLDAVRRVGSESHPMSPAWPDDSRDDTQRLLSELAGQLIACTELPQASYVTEPANVIGGLRDSCASLRNIEARLARDLEEKHGTGIADSAGFRQFMAEYECSFPAANLDDTRNAIKAVDELVAWLSSPSGRLGVEKAFVMTGAAGSGKTHGVCDVAVRRLESGRLTCICYGHEFRGEPEPWTRLREVLGLPSSLSRDSILDCLNAAAEASGEPLVLIIDAINETKPLSYWRDRVAGFCDAMKRRLYLRLCLTCRTSFAPHCLPQRSSLFVADHRGFEGIERAACHAFFEHYGLEPPVTPILQPEITNPLYLRLVCDTARSQGLKHLPTGWTALATTVKSFLCEKERQFSAEHETSLGATIVAGSLLAVARELARSGEPSLSWTRAYDVVSAARPSASRLPVLEWLVRSDLLIEDAPRYLATLDAEISVRPSFERLGDFLIADALLEGMTPAEIRAAFRSTGRLSSFVADAGTVAQNNGIISVLSLLVPERLALGTELVDLIDHGPVRNEILPIVVASFPLRDPATFSGSSIRLVGELLGCRGTAFAAMDAVISITWQESVLDAFWLDVLLKEKPLAKRDAFWCGYLHTCHERHGPVRRLIDAAFETPLPRLAASLAERWSVALLWFTAAADRRVKDLASRAATAVLRACPETTVSVIGRLMAMDDDAVRERVLLVAYGVALQTRNTSLLTDVCRWLYDRLQSDPHDFDNAVVRDHARCIAELADYLRALPEGCDVAAFRRPLGTEWPLDLPSDEDIARWTNEEKLPCLAYSCLDEDFFRYTMSCLHGWEDAVARIDMGRWVLREVVEGLAYSTSDCSRYDKHIVGKYGAGRSKPVWAERIGKKYQWIAMFRLAARLADHVEWKCESWEPPPSIQPLILGSERQLDPTLPLNIAEDQRNESAWWIPAAADLDKYATLSDEEWINRSDDLPTLDNLLITQERDGQRWRLLEAYPSWDRRPPGSSSLDAIYRSVWIHVRGYLVPSRNAKQAFDCLVGRNFYNNWMPQGETFIHGFAAEYPWATAYSSGYQDFSSPYKFPCVFLPVCNSIAAEWEYDASLSRNIHINVPARQLFVPGDLWWNGTNGFASPYGQTLFQDPSVTEKGPRSLLADADKLGACIDKRGYQLIWTLLGEKLVAGGLRGWARPRRTFSQVARLHRSGRLQVGELACFDNYDASLGPRQS